MNEFLKSILDGIYTVVGNYGWAIILFTLLIKLIILPFDVKSRKSMRKTQLIQPELTRLQKKYANDKEKLNRKTMELYKQNNISPLSSCLPLLLTMPVLFAMFAAMRMIADEEVAKQLFTFLQGGTPEFEGWFWIKNIWMPDSPFNSMVPNANTFATITADVWQRIYNGLGEAQSLLPTLMDAAGNVIPYDFSTAETCKTVVAAMTEHMIALPEYQQYMSLLPGTENLKIMFIGSISIYTNWNGLVILPILASATQLLMTKMTPTAAPANPDQPNPGNGAFMKWFFPIFSLVICFQYNAAFALYWVASNVIAAAQTFLLNKYLDAKDAKAKKVTVGEGSIK